MSAVFGIAYVIVGGFSGSAFTLSVRDMGAKASYVTAFSRFSPRQACNSERKKEVNILFRILKDGENNS